MTKHRVPLWLFLPLLLAGCVGLVAAASMATIALDIGVGGNHSATGYAVFIAAPIIALALIAGGAIALWHGHRVLAITLSIPPAALGFALIWLDIKR